MKHFIMIFPTRLRKYLNVSCPKIYLLVIMLIINIFLVIQLMNSNNLNPAILKIQQDRIKERKLLLTGQYPSEYSDIKSLPDKFLYGTLYSLLAPEVYCKDMLKIGRVFDGGKWLCNPLKIQNFEECIIYSFGLNNEISFEEHLYKVSGEKCQVKGFDQGPQSNETLKKLSEIGGSFKQAKIANSTNVQELEYTFIDIIRTNKVKHIEILKIDVEGAETVIVDFLNAVSVCHLLIEIHGKLNIFVNGVGTGDLKDYLNVEQTLELLRKISRQGFYLFSYELNIWVHEVAEYSFIHESCLEKYDVHTIVGKYLT